MTIRHRYRRTYRVLTLSLQHPIKQDGRWLWFTFLLYTFPGHIFGLYSKEISRPDI